MLRTRIALFLLIFVFLFLGTFYRQVRSISGIHVQTVENELQNSLKNWNYSDLRMIDQVDAPLPSQDIVATYARSLQVPHLLPNLSDSIDEHLPGLQIRIDFLDLGYTSDCDIVLLLNYFPGGQNHPPDETRAASNWNSLVEIFASGEIRVSHSDSIAERDMSILVERDATMDAVVVDLSTKAFQLSNQGIQIQAFTFDPEHSIITDETTPFRAEGPPPEPSTALFAFWNTMPAYTPIQAVRRWDGAHTGPLGGRHGLFNLLRTARNEQIPLVLLDLKTPSSLVALEYLDALPMVRQMAEDHLLILPDTLPEIEPDLKNLNQDHTLLEYHNSATEISRDISVAFDLPASQFLSVLTIQDLPDQYPYIFLRSWGGQSLEATENQSSTPFFWQGKKIIPIPVTTLNEQAAGDGLSLKIRKLLVDQAYLANQPNHSTKMDLLIFGGDLPSSDWGIPQSARSGFRYISTHPWISVLGADELAAFQLSSANTGSFIPLAGTEIGYPDPDLQGSWESWLAMFSLFGPNYPAPDAFSTNYHNGYRIRLLQQAFQWAALPYDLFDCKNDLDLDGYPDCLLATRSQFAMISLREGSIMALFILDNQAPHQILQPLFAGSIRDISSHLQIPSIAGSPDSFGAVGAFGDGFGPYAIRWDGERAFLSGKNSHKTFEFSTNGMNALIQTDNLIDYQILVELDPWLRFHSGPIENRLKKVNEEYWIWGYPGGPQVAIRGKGILGVNAAQSLLNHEASTENPDREIPPNLYVPFSTAIISTKVQTSLSIKIELIQ